MSDRAPEVRIPLFSLTKAKEENTKRAVKHFLKETLNNRGQLLWIVAGGYEHWMPMAREAFQGFQVDDEFLGQLFEFLKQEAGPEPGKQLDGLIKGGVVGIKLEFLQKIASAMETERDLDEFLSGKMLRDPFQKAAIRQELLRLINARCATVH